MSAISYRGRRVRLSGYVRVDSVTGGGAGLWMRIDGATATLGFDNMISYGRPITGTTGWLLYNVVLDVPADAVGVTIGALFVGRGLMRIDDVKFEIVDTTIADAATRAAWHAISCVRFHLLVGSPERGECECEWRIFWCGATHGRCD